jgi:hypothetical protein
VLIQLFLLNQHSGLRYLVDSFELDLYIMSEVETEAASNKRFFGYIKPGLEKALRQKLIKILSTADLEFMQEDRPEKVGLSDIRELGRDFAVHVGTGEAYTFAAGVLLCSPVASNDFRAIQTMQANGKVLPPHVLRAFDILALLHAEGHISIKDFDQCRKDLNKHGEHIPKAFLNTSVEDGLSSFQCRLLCASLTGWSGEPWAQPFVLRRVSDTEE